MPKAIEILKANPDGVRYAALLRLLEKEFPNIPHNAIHGVIYDLGTRLPQEVYKPARGLFRHAMFREDVGEEEEAPPPAGPRVREEEFYKPFAEYLVGGLDECTKAVPLGGNRFRDKWGTPDVIGIRKPRQSADIKPPTEIVAAEVKIDTANLITAFGQACSYKLFSHRSYIVAPKESSAEDIDRLDALCVIFGIGLILFDANNPEAPGFEIRARAAKHEPDMFYVDKYMRLVEDELF